MKRETRSRLWSIKSSLRAKVTFGIVLPLLLILGTFTTIEYARHRRVVLDNLSLLASQSGKVIENTLRNEMLVSNFAEVQTILDSIGQTGQFRVVYLLNTSGKVIFAPQGQDVGARLDNQHPTCQPCHELPPAARPESVVVTADDGQRVFRSMQPIENKPECSRCHDPNERLIGLLLTDIPTAPMEATLAADLRENLLWWVGTILVSVLIVNLVINRFVIQRLEGLAHTLHRFGQGNLDLRLSSDSPDEIGQLAQAFNQMGHRIENEASENRALSDHLRRQSNQRGELLRRLITAQEDERKRVARELHDDLGQALGALALQTEAATQLITSQPSRAISQLDKIRGLVKETTDRMYDLILALRPSALDDLGLAAALHAHADRTLKGTGIAFEMDTTNLGERLPLEIETALYRIFQEALSNVVRHSGARHVRITLRRQNGAFEGQIQDDGAGFDPQAVRLDSSSPQGLGLLGMEERVLQCGGHLVIASQPGSGTRITVHFPLLEVERG